MKKKTVCINNILRSYYKIYFHVTRCFERLYRNIQIPINPLAVSYQQEQINDG